MSRKYYKEYQRRHPLENDRYHGYSVYTGDHYYDHIEDRPRRIYTVDPPSYREYPAHPGSYTRTDEGFHKIPMEETKQPRSKDKPRKPPSPSEEDTTSEPSQSKGVGAVFARFAESTTMTGVSRIVGSKKHYAKFLWTVLVLTALGFLTFHLYYLFTTFLSFPVKNDINLGFSSLLFPAVTICNVNPVRMSKMAELSPGFASLVETLQTTNLESLVDALPDWEDYYDYYSDDNPTSSTTASTTTTSTSAPSTTTTTARRRRRRRKRQTSTSTNARPRNGNILDSLNIGFENVSDPIYDLGDDYDYEDFDDWEDSWESEAEQSTFSKIEEMFTDVYTTESREARIAAGHQLNDMLVSCSFAGLKCYADNFTLSTSSKYGNCYTLQYNKLISRNSGPGGGLELILFLETDEYIRSITPDTGLQVAVHPQQTLSFPDDEGLSIAGGASTSLSLRRTTIRRKGDPYSTCTDNSEFETKYGLRYTRQTCQRFCLQTEVHRQCRCMDETREDINIKMDIVGVLRPCRTAADIRCLEKVEWDYQQRKINCNCNNPCQDIKYEKTLSARTWPHKSLSGLLVKILCHRESTEVCSRLQQLGTDYQLSQEFVKLKIYYEDLNYEDILENADYELVQFISDIGGTLGLWIGLSVLSIFEFFQLAMELVRHFCCCRWRQTA